MDQERQEVYERIPWETLEKKSGDRQWLIMAAAGAIAVGALAFSFMRSQPVAAPPQSVAAAVTVPATVSSIPVAPATTSPPSPVVVAEADLYAVDPAQMASVVASHAEWFAVEYFSYDGSAESASTLSALLPSGVPLPEGPEDVQVFVDWVGSGAVTEIAPLTYEVEVVVRSLMAQGETAFVRQPARLAKVTLTVGQEGRPQVLAAPLVEVHSPMAPAPATLVPVPPDIQTQIETNHGPVIGGEQTTDGSWRIVAMVTGIDGVRRPQTVTAP